MFLELLDKFAFPALIGVLGYTFASYKYRAEKWWEPRVATYQVVVNAMLASYTLNRSTATEEEREREQCGYAYSTPEIEEADKARRAVLLENHRVERQRLEQVVVAGPLWFSATALDCIHRYIAHEPDSNEIDKQYPDPLDYYRACVEHDWLFIKEFSAIAKIDLGIEDWPERLKRWKGAFISRISSSAPTRWFGKSRPASNRKVDDE